MSGRVCRNCGRPVSQKAEKALSGEWAVVWADDADGEWVCEVTGDEHDPI